MNRPANLIGAQHRHGCPRSPEGASVPKSLNPIGAPPPVLTGGCHPTGGTGAPSASTPIGARPATQCALSSPTGEAGAPNLSNLCPMCGCEAHRCKCPWPGDDEMMPASDVCRIMADYFPDTGWARAERSALGMVKL